MPETAFDPDFELIPASTLEVTPDEQLSATEALLDEEEIELVEDEPEPYGRSLAFNHETKSFTLHGGSPAWTDDLDTLRQWIMNVVWTQRMAHTIFSDDFGMDDPFVLVGQPLQSHLWQSYRSDITEALLVHDRIAEVESIDMQIDPDDATVVLVDIEIVTDTAEQVQIEGFPVSA